MNENRPLDGLLKRGMHLAVCQMATRRYGGSTPKNSRDGARDSG